MQIQRLPPVFEIQPQVGVPGQVAPAVTAKQGNHHAEPSSRKQSGGQEQFLRRFHHSTLCGGECGQRTVFTFLQVVPGVRVEHLIAKCRRLGLFTRNMAQRYQKAHAQRPIVRNRGELGEVADHALSVVKPAGETIHYWP